MTYRLIEKRKSEQFIYKNIYCVVYFEPNGDGEIHLDAGDWIAEQVVYDTETIEELKNKTIDFIDTLDEEG